MSKQRKQTKQAGMGNTAYIEAMREIRRSSASQPHRNRSKYNRNDYRATSQKGEW